MIRGDRVEKVVFDLLHENVTKYLDYSDGHADGFVTIGEEKYDARKYAFDFLKNVINGDAVEIERVKDEMLINLIEEKETTMKEIKLNIMDLYGQLEREKN